EVDAEEDDYKLADEPAPAPAVTLPKPQKTAASAPSRENSSTTVQRPLQPSPAVTVGSARRAWGPPTRSSTPAWVRHLHWCLALAMIPLAVSVFVPDSSEAESIAAPSSPIEDSAAQPTKSSPSSVRSQPATEPTTDEEARLEDSLSEMSVD